MDNIYVFADQYVYTLRKHTQAVFRQIFLSRQKSLFLKRRVSQSNMWSLRSAPGVRLQVASSSFTPFAIHKSTTNHRESADRSVQPVNREMKVKVPSVLCNGTLYLLSSGPDCRGSTESRVCQLTVGHIRFDNTELIFQKTSQLWPTLSQFTVI